MRMYKASNAIETLDKFSKWPAYDFYLQVVLFMPTGKNEMVKQIVDFRIEIDTVSSDFLS